MGVINSLQCVCVCVCVVCFGGVCNVVENLKISRLVSVVVNSFMFCNLNPLSSRNGFPR